MTPKLNPPPHEEFDGMKAYLKELEGQLSELHKFLERLVSRVVMGGALLLGFLRVIA